MEEVEVIDLMTEIKKNYPQFDTSDENIVRHLKYLVDFPFDVAMDNVEQYIKTSDFPPKIADIRGHLGDLLEGQKSKEQAQSYMAEMEAARTCQDRPPDGYWENIRKLLQGDQP